VSIGILGAQYRIERKNADKTVTGKFSAVVWYHTNFAGRVLNMKTALFQNVKKVSRGIWERKGRI
jgi:hypothetical protein